MRFFREKIGGARLDESAAISVRRKFLRALCAVAGGLLYAAALPPLNQEWAAFFALVPLFYLLKDDDAFSGAFHGFLWNFSWGIFGYRFLREIEACVPFFLAAVIAAWGGFFGWAAVKLRGEALFPRKLRHATHEEKKDFLRREISAGRQIACAVLLAALYTSVEWTRSRLFPWNDLAVTQYRNLPFIQLCAWTGSCGVTFGVALGNAGVFFLLFFPRGIRVFGVVASALALSAAGGFWRLYSAEQSTDSSRKLLLIQGDLSQRRHAESASVEEALTVYHSLTRRALAAHPDAEWVIWPECAIPVPYASDFDESSRKSWIGVFQTGMRHYEKPFLIGALDFRPDFTGMAEPAVTNSALLLERGKTLARYDKCHRVPFGEYIPCRSLLPQKAIDFIDMGRDLAPGVSHDPIRVFPGLRAGAVICFESVFSYIARDTVRRGANVIVVLSNDAWYPTSSEPEQHLANALLRAVETGVPMVRCGNNGGSLVVTPKGRIENVLVVPGTGRPELRRGRGFQLVTLRFASEPEKTFFLVYGEWFPWMLAFVATAWAVAAVCDERFWRRDFRARALKKN